MGAAGSLGLHDGMGVGGGLADVWTRLNAKHYNVSQPILQPESKVAEASFRAMLANASVTTIITNCEPTHVTTTTTSKSNSTREDGAGDGAPRITSVTLSCVSEGPITARVFVDASYDGDVMALAALAGNGMVEYTAGRESARTYNESLAGARAPSWAGVSGPKGINALRSDGTLLRYVHNISEIKRPGEADDALMAFQHRMCISGDADRVPWPKPDKYNPDDFELMQRVVDATGNADAFTRMPPGPYHGYPGPKKYYDLCCGITVAASDQPMLNKGWASASWARRREIVADHTYFELGTFYYLANDPKVPGAIRQQYQKYGLCRGEFAENNYMPWQLYVRISNRMVGDFVLTQNNICNPRKRDDSIAVGDWTFDEHMTGKYAVPDGKGGYTVMLEGNFWPKISEACPNAGPGGNMYDVPYAMIVPKRGQLANLIVPVAFSSSAVAYASARIESFFMYVGTAAGAAAAMALPPKKTAWRQDPEQEQGQEEDASPVVVQDVNVTKLQEILVGTFHQVIHVPSPTPPPANLPSYYNVTSAGTTQWNGKYVHAASGALEYHSTSCASCALYEYQGVWRLAVQGKDIVYQANQPSGLPPNNPDAWSLGSGKAPLPRLSPGPPKHLK